MLTLHHNRFIMDVKRVLYISQEINPYLPATPIATFSKKLPEALIAKGSEVRTFMPRYGIINERRNQLHEVIRLSGLNIVIDDTDHPLIIKVATLQPSRMQVYFIDNDDYFMHHSAKGLETETLFEENDERAIFFVRGVLETVKKLRWAPSIIHCTGWITALASLYLKNKYADDPTFANTKIVYSLYDNCFEGTLNQRMREKLHLDGFEPEHTEALGDAPDFITLNRLAMAYADAIAISSENTPQTLVDLAHQSGKPVLDFPGDDNLDAYREFYLSL